MVPWSFEFSLILLTPFVAAATAWAERPVDFIREVRPILSNKCFTCHGPDASKRKAGLRLDDAESGNRELESGATAVVPGDVDASALIERITTSDPDSIMPPPTFNKPVTAAEVALLKRWIKENGHFAGHWSYTRPVRATPPEPPAEWKSWPRNEIDRFALAAMLSHNLHPTPEADRAALARRLYLDLTGLPPTIDEVDAFVKSKYPQAYEKLVDQLLHRPAYGEHWARLWLDLARYADSAGYADDPPRTIWAYRDWVIRAFNSNMPFDEFTIEQIAGDLLPNPTENQLIATAFHRNTLTNNEGGTQDEEFRNVALVDRVNTTMAVWMGTTMACAQCHNHKYDPISQKEYFQFFAVLNNTADADLMDESPLLPIYNKKQRRQLIQCMARAAATQAILISPTNVATQLSTVLLEKPVLERAANPTTNVPIYRELARPRETRIQHRGNYLDKGEVVQAGLPAAFRVPVMQGPINRLALARWLVSEENPLTARVLVNRYWDTLFGRGIVSTSEEFGSQGELPTHPELLDWLAVDFMESGWDTRELLRKIVTSATYRQSSQVVGDAAKIDPDNRWLARGPRVRLSAEMIRDQVLAVSGLLSGKMYGPPVHPPQPSLGLNAAFGSSTDWETSKGEDRYRRAIYTTWRRSNPYPSMATFDAPNRETCTLRRNATNTPLQSLVTLNDPAFIEAAQALARLALQHGGSADERIAYMLKRCLLRAARPDETKSLVRLYNDSHTQFAGQPAAAKEMATVPLGRLPAGIDVADAASMTVVANVLLNLDETFLKR